MRSYSLPLISSLLGGAYAASHSVDVGEGGIIFSPNSTTAAVGDTVTFHFYPRAHGVARSSYSSPCSAMDNGFNSGLVPVTMGESNTTFTITINNTDPIWYYCPQTGHCQGGMVGVINPPSSGNETIGGFAAAASTAQESTASQQVYGGVLAANGTAGGDVAGGSSSAHSASSATMSMGSSSHASSTMGSSTRSMTGSSASAAKGTASHSGSATSHAASATSSVAASTGAAASLRTVGILEAGLGLLVGGWCFL